MWAKVENGPDGGESGNQESHRLDSELIRRSLSQVLSMQVAYLVDMAKAEALGFMGEHRAAVETVEQHL